jgi:hypothetical protein
MMVVAAARSQPALRSASGHARAKAAEGFLLLNWDHGVNSPFVSQPCHCSLFTFRLGVTVTFGGSPVRVQ